MSRLRFARLFFNALPRSFRFGAAGMALLLVAGTTTTAVAGYRSVRPETAADAQRADIRPSDAAAAKPAEPKSAAAPQTGDSSQAASQPPAAGTADAPAASPKPTPAPANRPTPACPECAGNPDKAVARTGNLILSTPSITITAGGVSEAALSVRSDSGEAITVPFVSASENMHLPMLGPGNRPVGAQNPTYAATQSFGFNASPGTKLGTYRYKLEASSAERGLYSGYVNVTIVAP